MRGVGAIDDALAGSARTATSEASVASERRETLRDTGYLSAALRRGLTKVAACLSPATVQGMGGAAAREV